MRKYFKTENTFFYFFLFKTRIILSQLWYQTNLIALKNWRAQLVAKQVASQVNTLDLTSTIASTQSLNNLPWFDSSLAFDFALNPTKQYKYGFDKNLWPLKTKTKLKLMSNIAQNIVSINYRNLSILQLSGLGFKSKTALGQWSTTFLVAKQYGLTGFLPKIDNQPIDLELWDLCENITDFDESVNPEVEILQNPIVDYHYFSMEDLFKTSSSFNTSLHLTDSFVSYTHLCNLLIILSTFN